MRRSWRMAGTTSVGQKESIDGLSEFVTDFAWRAKLVWDCPHAVAPVAPAFVA